MPTAFSYIGRIAKARLTSRKVDFLIVGTQKGGTTALDAYLRLHPQICMAGAKEVHFFDNEELFASPLSRRALYGLYHENFHPQPQHRLLGECTPIYMYWAGAPQRIWEYNPYIKLIILLRIPIDRAYSQWNMQRRLGIGEADFYGAIRDEPDRCREALPFQHRHYSYVDRGRYAEQLKRYLQYFPPSSTLILSSEQLRSNPAATLRRLTDFVGVTPFENVTPLEVHQGIYTRPMSPKERSLLEQIFEPEIRELEYLIDCDLSHWLDERHSASCFSFWS